MKRMFLLASMVLVTACQTRSPDLTDATRKAIADSVDALSRGAFDAVRRRDAGAFAQNFSTGPDLRVVENGVVYTNRDAFRDSTAAFWSTFSAIEPTLSEMRTVVLGPDAASTVIPFSFTATTKAGKTAKGSGVWSAVFRRDSSGWTIVQTHESELNLAQLLSELMPPSPAAPATKR